jgi:PAS domain S-box-containing protein
MEGDYTILVVDDNATLLKLSRDTFAAFGYNVLSARDGEEALKILHEAKIDLVVTDVLMPNIDGYMLCAKIRSDKLLRDIPVMIYTATYTSASDEALATQIGADKFIRKPAPMKVLTDAAAQLLMLGRQPHNAPEKWQLEQVTRQYSEGLVEKLERKNIELEEIKLRLEKSEQQLKEAHNIARIGSWEIDLQNGSHTWSDEFFRLFGISRKNVAPGVEQFASLIHPDDRSMASREMEKAFATGRDSYFNFRFIRQDDDSLRYGLSLWRFELSDKNVPVRLAGIIQDVTDKKTAEEALQTAHNRLRFHIENTPLGFIEWDEKLYVKAWSRRAEAIFGWSEEEFTQLQKTGYSQVYEEDMPLAAKVAEQLISGEVTRSKIQHRNRTKDGRVIWCEWFNSALKDKEGKVITIMSLVQDITERKAMEQSLSEFNERYKMLSKATNDAIWDWNIETDTEVWNHGIQTIFGYNDKQVASSHTWWKNKIHPADYPRVQQEIQDANGQTETNWTSEYRFLCANGSYKHVLDRAYIIYRGDKPVRMIGAMQDITELVRYRQNLEEMVKERTHKLNQALEKEKELVGLKSRFISIASHEFRTPLSTISLATGFLQKYLTRMAPDQVTQKLEEVEKQVKQMTYLLDDVLLVGKAEAGKIKINLSRLPMAALKQIAGEAVESIGTHALVYSEKCDEKEITTDEKLIRNIVTNLLTNAVKFSPDKKKVYMDVSCDLQRMKITVRDEGIGIPSEEIEELFIAFSRGSNVGSIEGTGLGLSIVKKAVDLLDGSLDVKSELGKGTEFKIVLPLQYE